LTRAQLRKNAAASSEHHKWSHRIAAAVYWLEMA
jgi:hypothetical protein